MRRDAHRSGGVVPIEPVRANTCSSSTVSGPAPASFAATQIARVLRR
ncbi:hypothetical protein FM103_17980 [Corynebacterium xerosis]|nr:hypothetical protein FM103_17980 [Corynebacterium xerosis]